MAGGMSKILPNHSTEMFCILPKLLIHKSIHVKDVCMQVILLLSKRSSFFYHSQIFFPGLWPGVRICLCTVIFDMNRLYF